jgi:hypothetical protein
VWQVRVCDSRGAETWSNETRQFVYFIHGDANGNRSINLEDAICLLNYLFKNGDAPDPLEPGDAIYLLNYLFKNGPPPGC